MCVLNLIQYAGIGLYAYNSIGYFGLEWPQYTTVGMNMTQTGHSIIIDQDHYVQGLELPQLSITEGLNYDDQLCSEGQTIFRACVAKILHVGYQSRPDICFQAKC